MKTLNITAAQLNFKVGSIEDNAQRIIDTAHSSSSDILVFPELCLTGYPPEDLLFRPALFKHVKAALHKIQTSVKNTAVVVGYPEEISGKIYNKAAFIAEGKVLAEYAKQKLPNYTVFDEKRYFTPGMEASLCTFKGIKIALLICEDLWQEGPITQAAAAHAELILALNASPFGIQQQNLRESLLKKQATETTIPILYCNLIGGQDELVFDGGSFAINADSKIAQQASFFKEELMNCEFDSTTRRFKEQKLPENLSREEKIYDALVLGLKDYVNKNNFSKVILGASGGIDSALSLAIAVDALGPDRVEAILMPSRHTESISNEDAIEEAENLKSKYQIIPIEETYKAFLNTLKDVFAHHKIDLTEQNIQARCRAVILMALSNKLGSLVLTTSNKSEVTVGFSTLYGDMAGGFCVLKDVLKTDVYRLAHYRNSISAVIPKRVLERAPSAELADNQLDQDSLPPYEILDEIIKLYVEQDQDAEAIIAQGFDVNTVNDVIKKIKYNEYKRRQAPLGIRLKERAFGRDRRYPITSGY